MYSIQFVDKKHLFLNQNTGRVFVRFLHFSFSLNFLIFSEFFRVYLQAKFLNNYHDMLSDRFPSASIRGQDGVKAKKGRRGGWERPWRRACALLAPLLGSDCDWARFKAAESWVVSSSELLDALRHTMGAVTLEVVVVQQGIDYLCACANQPISPFRESTVWISACRIRLILAPACVWLCIRGLGFGGGSGGAGGSI